MLNLISQRFRQCWKDNHCEEI